MQLSPHQPGSEGTGPGGTASPPASPYELSNPYLDAVRGTLPDELVEYEMATYPYGNMLPGISNIRAAQTVAGGLEAGRKGRWRLRAVSVVMLLALLAPGVISVVDRLLGR